MIYKKITLSLLSALVFCFLCESREQVLVAAAGNLRFIIDEIITGFNDEFPETDIEYTIASSGKLTFLITRGAPFDIFLSADLEYPELLFKEGHASFPPEVYAMGTIVLFFKRPFFTIDDHWIFNKKVTLVIANPDVAPYGIAAKSYMDHSGISKQFQGRLVQTENVAQIVHYMLLGSADIAILPVSLLHAGEMKAFNKEGRHWQNIPGHLYEPVKQGVVLTTRGEKNSIAVAFKHFLFSAECRELFKSGGYCVPEKTEVSE